MLTARRQLPPIFLVRVESAPLTAKHVLLKKCTMSIKMELQIKMKTNSKEKVCNSASNIRTDTGLSCALAQMVRLAFGVVRSGDDAAHEFISMSIIYLLLDTST